jgi:hypothetical protein
MKNILLIVLAAFLAVAAVSCKGGDSKDGKQPEAAKFDFRKAVWGMNHEEVKATEDMPPTGERAELITYRDDFDGMDAIVGYLFDGDKLIRAGYLIQNPYEDHGKYIADYDRVKEQLIKDYGSPAQDNMVWSPGHEETDPAKYGESVCAGKLRYVTMWFNARTQIRETLDGEDGKCRMGIMFESIEMYVKPMIEKSKASQSTPAP